MTATDQVARMLALVPYLQRLPGTTLTEAAIEFGVDPDQILNDLRALWMCGLPGGLPDDLIEVDMDGIEADGQIYISNAEYLTRPITFSHEEATALTVALHAIAEAATEEVAAGAASAAAKLQELTGRAPDVEVELEAGQLRIRQLLQQAIKDGVRVLISYATGDSRFRVLWTEVEPALVHSLSGYLYLEAYRSDRDEWRTYRLDRIEDVQLTETPATHTDGPLEFESDWIKRLTQEGVVRLEFGQELAWLTDRYPVTEVVANGDTYQAVFPVARSEWLVALLMRHGGKIKVIEPAEFGKRATEVAQECLDWYRETGLG